MSPRRLCTLLVLPVAAAALAGCAAGDEGTGAEREPSAGATSAPGDLHGAEVAELAMPDVTLTDTSGSPFNLLTDTTDPITLVFFGYTHCPDVCDLVLSDLTVAISHLPEQVADETEVLFVTTDPARDTPAALRSYLDRFDPSYVGLTGDLADIKAAATAMQVAIDGRKQLPSGGYDIGHGAQVTVFLHDRAPVVWTEGTPYPAMVADITSLAGL